jgi:hypothetical protein
MAKKKAKAKARTTAGPKKARKKVADPKGKKYKCISGVIAAPSCPVAVKAGKDWLLYESDIIPAGTDIALDPKAEHTKKWLREGAIK